MLRTRTSSTLPTSWMVVMLIGLASCAGRVLPEAPASEAISHHLVVITVDVRSESQGFQEAYDSALALLRAERNDTLAGARVEVLRERSGSSWWAKPVVEASNALRSRSGMKQLLALPGNREHRDSLPDDFEMPPHPAIDHLLIIDLEEPPSSEQVELLGRIRDLLGRSATVGMSISRRYLIFQQSEPNPDDDRLVFRVPWRVDGVDAKQTQQYWREQHGPLAYRLIMQNGQKEMKRYEQIHFDRERSTGVFDSSIQGLAMQYVDSMEEAFKASAVNLKSLCTNTELAIDELNFTQGPSLLFFEDVSEEVGW